MNNLVPLRAPAASPVRHPALAEIAYLKQRLDAVHLRQRLGMEEAQERAAQRIRDQFWDGEAWYSRSSLIAASLKLTGMYWRGRRNAGNVVLRRHRLAVPGLPRALHGLSILQISDVHVERSAVAIDRVLALLKAGLDYDVCVLTGDLRAGIVGPFQAAVDGLRALRAHIRGPVYAVLGNHDTVRMVPGLEAMDIRVLLNEALTIRHHGAAVHFAGIDDAHYFRTHNIQKVATRIEDAAVSILLSHTPEVYREAAHAGFDVMLSGHTHGGQICLPGSVPITLEAKLPRRMGAGPWRYQGMAGYTSTGLGTSVVPVRFNCPAEITLHTLTGATGAA